MRIRFERDFDFRVNSRVTVAYKGGQEYTLPRDHGAAALQAGAGVEVRPARRGVAPAAPSASDAQPGEASETGAACEMMAGDDGAAD